MTTPSGSATAPIALLPSSPAAAPMSPELHLLLGDLGELAEDLSVPRNVRRGAQSAKLEIERPRVALDVRIASAVSVLDELANDPNLPTHGRTAIWTMISRLESLQ